MVSRDELDNTLILVCQVPLSLDFSAQTLCLQLLTVTSPYPTPCWYRIPVNMSCAATALRPCHCRRRQSMTLGSSLPDRARQPVLHPDPGHFLMWVHVA